MPELSLTERVIANEAGGDTWLAGKLIALSRSSEIFTDEDLIALARCAVYSDQIADISLGTYYRGIVRGWLKPLNTPNPSIPVG